MEKVKGIDGFNGIEPSLSSKDADLIEMIQSLNVIDDAFFQKIVEDKEVCEEILRIILEKPDLEIIESEAQKSLRNSGRKSVVLDAFCRDSSGRYYNVEMQKYDEDDYQKRVRYNASNLDTYVTEKGLDYKELPEIYVVFISKFDIFKEGKTTYYVDRVLRGSGTLVDNGIHEIYVNAKGGDSSDTAELMKYFLDSNGGNEKFPKLAKRVDYFKNIKEGVGEMSEFKDKIMEWGREEGRAQGRAQGREEGRAQEKISVASKMKAEGIGEDIIAKTTGLSKEEIEKL